MTDRTPTGDLRDRIDVALRTVGLARNLAAYRDAVLTVVEAALAQQAAEIDEDIIKPERALHEQTIQRAEQAERQRDAALAALRDLTDGRPCAPHPGNGWCQTHGERAPCPHAEAGRLLAARDAEKPEETTPAEHTPGANAEDCPACSGRRDLPYPFICPGAALDQPEETPH